MISRWFILTLIIGVLSLLVTVPISLAVEWSATINADGAADNGNLVTLTFGTKNTATDFFDEPFDQAIPSWPADTKVIASFPVNPNDPLRDIIGNELQTDYRKDVTSIIWTLNVSQASVQYVLNWNVTNIPSDRKATLKDPSGITYDMRQINQLPASTKTGNFTISVEQGVVVLDPSIASINPTSLAQGSTNQNVTILGSNFQSGAAVAFSGTGVTVNSVTFNSATQLTANTSIASTATIGSRDITVTNPNGKSSTAAGVFSVTQKQQDVISISISSISVNFGNITVGQSSDQTITITNQSASGTLTGSVSSLSSPFSVVSGGGSFSLSPGQSRQVLIRFSPISTGSFSGTLSITHTATNQSSPTNVPLSGASDGTQRPTVVTTAATNVTSNSAILNGTVNPNGASTTYYFEYGTTTSYGSKTPIGDAGSGTSAISISFPISGLSPNTTYHYRLVAINSGGTNYGFGITFITGTVTPPPANTKIAFSSRSRTNEVGVEIYVMNIDGSDVRRLTISRADNREPMWSPDGKRIAFWSTRDGNKEIYVMNADGTNPIRLTNHPAEDYSPSWSPDGKRIAFVSNRDGNYEIYTMNDDGSNIVRLTNIGWFDEWPKWSPDGKQIVFSSNRDWQESGNGFNHEIYVMNANGTNVRRLTNLPGWDRSPSWSPDGSRIAFTSTRDGNAEIYVINADGLGLVNITRAPSQESDPNWSPDGTKIVFHGWDNNIYIMNSDGTNPVNLSIRNKPFAWTQDYSPSWSPYLPPEPILTIISPQSDQILPVGTTSTTLTVNIANHTGHWHWQLNTPFPSSGTAGGNMVTSGNSAAITGLENGQKYTAYVTLVDANHNALGLSTTKSVTFSVNTDSVSLTIDTNPPGLQITVDGKNYTAPQTFTTWTPGSQHTIGVNSPQSGTTGKQYVFSSWSDNRAQTHSITAPSIKTTYAANFTTQYQLTVSAAPTVGGTTNPTGQSWHNSGDRVSISATPNVGYKFIGWSGDATGTSNPIPVMMDTPKSVTAIFEEQPPKIRNFWINSFESNRMEVSWKSTDNVSEYEILVATDPNLSDVVYSSKIISQQPKKERKEIREISLSLGIPYYIAIKVKSKDSKWSEPYPSPPIQKILIPNLVEEEEEIEDGKIHDFKTSGVSIENSVGLEQQLVSVKKHDKDPPDPEGTLKKKIKKYLEIKDVSVSFKARLLFHYTIDEIQKAGLNEDTMRLTYYNGSAWREVHTTRDKNRKVLWTETEHFSIWTITEPKPTNPAPPTNLTAEFITDAVDGSHYTKLTWTRSESEETDEILYLIYRSKTELTRTNLDSEKPIAILPEGKIHHIVKVENNIDRTTYYTVIAQNATGIKDSSYAAGNIVVKSVREDTKPPDLKVTTNQTFVKGDQQVFIFISSDEELITTGAKELQVEIIEPGTLIVKQAKVIPNNNKIFEYKTEATGPDGIATIKVIAHDKYFNKTGKEKIASFTIDRTPPIINVKTDPEGVNTAASVKINVASNEVIKLPKVEVIEPSSTTPKSVNMTSIDKNTFSGTYPVSATVPEGKATITVIAHDEALNETISKSSFIIDRTPPLISIIIPGKAEFGTLLKINVPSNEPLRLTGKDALSVIVTQVGANPVSVEMKAGSSPDTYEGFYEVRASKEGKATITATGADIAGNIAVPATSLFEVEEPSNKPPTASVLDASIQDKVMYPGIPYTVTSIYKDAYGYKDIKEMQLRIANGNKDIIFKALGGDLTKGEKPEFESGISYIKSASYDRESSGNQIKVAWHFILNWNWIESNNIRFAVKAIDNLNQVSKEETSEFTGSYRNKLTFTGTLTAKGSIQGILAKDSWVKGGEKITWEGLKVIFENSNISPDDNDFNIEIIDNNNRSIGKQDKGTELNLNTTSDTVTNPDITYTLKIVDIPQGGLDISNQTWKLKIDADPPTNVGLVAPHNNAVDVPVDTPLTIRKATDSGSDLPEKPYSIELAMDKDFTKDKKESGWISAEEIWEPVLQYDKKYYWKVKVIDKVGNKSEEYGIFTTTISPPAIRASDGFGKFEIVSTSPSPLIAANTGNEIRFRFIAEGLMDGGAISLEVPNGWSLPQRFQGQPGYTVVEASKSANIDEPIFNGQTVTIPINKLNKGQSIDIIYGKGGGPSGAKTPAQVDIQHDFIVKSMGISSAMGGQLKQLLLHNQPKFTLSYVPDGSGTFEIKSIPSSVIAGKSGYELTFIYMASGLIKNGKFSITLPDEWTPPQKTPGVPVYIYAQSNGFFLSQDTISILGQNITIPIPKLEGGQTIKILYVIGGTAKVPDSTGEKSLQAKLQSTESGNLSLLPNQSTLRVTGELDGTGMIKVETYFNNQPSKVTAGSESNQIKFIYTPIGTIVDGELHIEVPVSEGWSQPNKSNLAGVVSVTTPEFVGIISIEKNVIKIPIKRLEPNQSLIIQYGNVSVLGAVAPKISTTSKFEVKVKGSANGLLLPIKDQDQPIIIVENAADGSGEVTFSSNPIAIYSGQSGIEMTFVYKAVGTMDGGGISLKFPAGWSQPQGELGKAGYTVVTSTGQIGTIEFITYESTVKIPIIKLGSNETITITYGFGGGGSGGKAPSVVGTAPLTIRSQGSATGTLQSVAQISVTIKPKPPNTSPTISQIGSQAIVPNQPIIFEVNEEVEISFNILANDKENDPITYKAENLPKGSSFDATTAKFSWKPTYDLVSSSEGRKIFVIKISATDDQLTDTKEVTLRVNQVSRAADLTIELSPDKLVADGKSKSKITVKVFDSEGKPVADEVVSLKANLGQIVSPATNNNDGTYTSEYTSTTSTGNAIITATTSNNKSKEAAITLTLEDTVANIQSVEVKGSLAKAGEKISIILKAEAGGNAKFSIEGLLRATGIGMKETSPEVYEGEHLVVKGDDITDAKVKINFEDKSGNKAENSSQKVTIDTIPPPKPPELKVVGGKITINNQSSVEVTGKASSDAEVNISLSDGEKSIDKKVKAGAEGLFKLMFDTTSLKDGTVSITAFENPDQVGNIGEKETISVIKDTLVEPISISTLNPDTVDLGVKNVDIIVTGKNFIGTVGAGFPGIVIFSDVKINVNSIKYDSSVQLTMNITIAEEAAIGARDFILIYPGREIIKRGSALKVEARWDVNKDREVNIFDLVLVANNFGQPISSPPPEQNPDVNKDGKVDLFDFVIVGNHFGEKISSKAAPMRDYAYQEHISKVLSDVDLLKHFRDFLKTIPNPNQGIQNAIAELEYLISLANPIVKETKLLPNYPNPFNPETWIPYQLANSADVSIRIYDVAGRLVRTLNLGRKEVGLYMTKDRAAYWDGRNDAGEPVSSGVYFYELAAGNFHAVKKMIILK